jgi:hypothetical protein
MKEEQISFKTIISKIKKDFKLNPDFDKKITYDDFSIFAKGDFFKKYYQWRIDDFNYPVYLVSVSNSIRTIGINPMYDGSVRYRSFKYVYCYLEFNIDVPNTIIRPASFPEIIISSLFHNRIRLRGFTRFNLNYILESNDEIVIQNYLTIEIIELIEKLDDIYVEFRNNKCMIKYLRTPSYIDLYNVIQLSKLIIKM